MHDTEWCKGLAVSADGRGQARHVGGVHLRLLAERTGPTAALVRKGAHFGYSAAYDSAVSRPESLNTDPATAGDEEQPEADADADADLFGNGVAEESQLQRAERIYKEHLAANKALSGAELGRLTGYSPAHARRLLGEFKARFGEIADTAQQEEPHHQDTDRQAALL